MRGWHEWDWQAKNAVGRRISSGLYVAHIWKYVCWKTVYVHLFARGSTDSPDTHSESEKEGENRDKRITRTVGACMTRLSTNSAACWGDTGVCRIQGHRRCDGLRGAGKDRGPPWTVEQTPVKKTSPSLSIPLMVSSLSFISSSPSPYFSPFLNHHLNSPFSLPLLNPAKIAIKAGNHVSASSSSKL